MSRHALTTLTLLAALAGVAHATPIALRVAPAILELELQRGDTHRFAVTVGNEAANDLRVEVFTADLQLTPGGLPVIAPPGSRPQSCAAWLATDTDRFTIKPGADHHLNATITVPHTARGGAYGILGLRVSPAEPARRDPLSLTVVGNTGTLLMLTIRGPALSRAALADAHATVETDAVTIRALMRNDGNIHLRGTASAVIFGPDNRVRARIPLLPADAIVLPGGDRELAATWKPRALPPGEYRANIAISAPSIRHIRHALTFSVPAP